MEPTPDEKERNLRLQNEHHTRVKAKLLEMRHSNDATDVVIVCDDGKKFPAHKVLLQASSDFFNVMFNSSFKEAESNEVALREIESEAMKLVLDFIYFNPLDLSTLDRGSLEEIMFASHRLQMDVLTQQCYDRLLKTLTTNNYFSTWKVASLVDDNELKERVVDFIIRNLPTISDKPSFLDHSFEELEEVLIRINYLNITLEPFVVNRLLDWARKEAETDRKPYLKQLFAVMNLNTLPKEFIEKLRKDELVVADEEAIFCIESQLKMKREARTCEEIEMIRSYQLLRFRSDDHGCECNSIDLETGVKDSVNLPFVLKEGMCCVQYKNYIYFLGGKADANLYNTFIEYCLETNEATYKSPPPISFYDARACVVKDKLYIVGGKIRVKYIDDNMMDRCKIITSNRIYYYDFLKKEWMHVSVKNSTPRDFLSDHDDQVIACASSNNKLVFLYYDTNLNLQRIFSSNAPFDPRWDAIDNVPKEFSVQPHLTLVSAGNLYSFVQQENQYFLCIYNFEKKCWSTKGIRKNCLPQGVYCVAEVSSGRYCIACNKDNKICVFDSSVDSLEPLKLNSKCEIGFFDIASNTDRAQGTTPRAKFEINTAFYKLWNKEKQPSKFREIADNVKQHLQRSLSFRHGIRHRSGSST